MDNNNFITAEIYIKEEDIYEGIRIINSFENAKREKKWEDKETNNTKGNEKNTELGMVPACFLTERR